MERRLIPNKGGPLRPVERGRLNNRLIFPTAPDYEMSSDLRKTLKRVRTRKRRKYNPLEIPGI